MKKSSPFIGMFLLTSIYMIGNTNVGLAQNEDEDTSEIPVKASSISGSDTKQQTGEVILASGLNRFVVWTDFTPGNGDIFFRRSVDNGATWKSRVNLSANPGDSGNPRMAVSGSNVYAVWLQYNSEDQLPNIFFRGSTDNGATWGSKVKVSTSGTNFFAAPRIAASGSHVYIIWEDSQGVDEDVFFRRSIDNGANWQTVVNLSNNVGTSYAQEIVLSGSNLYVTWNDDTPGNRDILFRRSADGGATWKSTVNISNNGADSYGPEIAVSGSNVYIAWHGDTLAEPNVYDVLFRRSADGGAIWKSIVHITSGADASLGQIAVSGSNVYLVWDDWTPGAVDLMFRRSADNGATWRSIVTIRNDAEWWNFPQVATSGSNVYIIWEDPATNNIRLKHSTDSAVTWKPTVTLVYTAGSPGIAVSGSNVYVGWMDLYTSNKEVMLKYSTDAGVSWSSTRNLSNNNGDSFFGEIGV